MCLCQPTTGACARADGNSRVVVILQATQCLGFAAPGSMTQSISPPLAWTTSSAFMTCMHAPALFVFVHSWRRSVVGPLRRRRITPFHPACLLSLDARATVKTHADANTITYMLCSHTNCGCTPRVATACLFVRGFRYDNCGEVNLNSYGKFSTMRDALNATGRPILYVLRLSWILRRGGG